MHVEGADAQSSFCLALPLAWGMPPFWVAIHLEQGHTGEICWMSGMGEIPVVPDAVMGGLRTRRV